MKDKTLDQIVLIIDKCPNYSEYIYESTGVLSRSEDGYELTYRDDDLILHGYKTMDVPSKDTVIFPVRSSSVVIEHVYKLFDNLSFIFKNGDTVLFTYENDFPFAQVINRPTESTQINYEKFKHDYLLNAHEDFDGISKFRIDPIVSSPGFLALRNPSDIKIIRLDSMEKAFSLAKVDWAKEIRLLDSLHKGGTLSKQFFDFFNEKAKVELSFLNYQYQHYKQEIALSKEVELPKWPFENADSLAGYAYYNNILDYVEREFFTFDLGPKTINKKTPDYRKAYASINENTQLSDKEKTILLTRTIENIIDNYDVVEVQKFVTRFMMDVPNQELLHHVFDKYGDVLPEAFLSDIHAEILLTRPSSFELFLTDAEGEITTIETILHRNNGKLILIDFWASHCLPCILAIPQSEVLKSMYDDKGLQMVYISIDENKESWIKAAKKLSIYDYQEQYIVDPSRSSPMLNIYNLKSIPRYMLFDKTGKLVHQNAPGPGSDAIRELLDKYLSNEN